MKRAMLAITAVVLTVVVMASGGVDNVARGQTPLPAPANINVTDGGNPGEVVVSWDAVDGAVFYRIGWVAYDDYAALHDKTLWLEAFHFVDIGNRGQSSLTLTRLTPGILYAFIVASNDNRYGAPSWPLTASDWASLTLKAAPAQPVLGGPQLPSSPFSSSVSKYQAIDAGKNHTCGIQLDDTIECWGDNTQGQADAPEGEFLSVSAGGVYSCGIDFKYQLVCWGHTAILPPPDGDYIHVSVGDEHACAVTEAEDNANRIDCWGLRNNDGRTANQAEYSYGGYQPWLSVSAGSDYNCARNLFSLNGRWLSCWGNSAGNYDRFDHESDLKTVSAGSAHVCGLYENAAVACHGNDVHKQVSGLPSAQDEGAPEDFYAYSAISAGGRHTCGLRTQGNIRCWGDDLRGQATPPGDNDELRANEEGVGNFTAVSAGDAHTCGLRRDGTVACWGLNDRSQAAPR